MKKALSLLMVLVMVLTLCACGTVTPGKTPAANDETTAASESTGHIHVFSDATCLEAAVCVCGETDGAPLGHLFDDATCLTPMTCAMCSITEGDALGHSYSAATCMEPATCELCGETVGEPSDHSYTNGSCMYCGEPDMDYFDFEEDLGDIAEGEF